MSLIKIINSEHSAEFGQLITDIKANVLSYLEARQKAQKERMIIIGKIAEYKSSYPQRSKEHRALTTAMNEEGWSQDVISNNLLAYKEYKRLLNSHSDWHPLAEAASISHLVVIARSTGTGLRYDSLQYLKKYKSLPSIKAMRGYLGGLFDKQFQPKSVSALVHNKGEAFEIPVNDGKFLIHQDSTVIDYEKIQPTQEKLIQELKLIVEQIDKDKVFVDDVLRSQLEPIQHQLEILSDLAKPRSPKPKYI